MDFMVDKKLRLETIISLATILVIAVFSFAWVQYKVETIEVQQQAQQKFQQEVRQNYINREQLDYIVIERIHRMEQLMEKNFEELKKQIDETRN